MIQEFYDNHVFLYIMGGLCGVGVMIKIFLLIVYNKLIQASESMSNPKKNWLKSMRLRFESSYQLQLGVKDVDTYVDKYVSKIKYGGLLLSTWENLSGQTIGLCLLTGSFAGILGFVYECGKGPVLFTFFSGAWTAIIVNIVDNVVNISAHRQMLRFNLIDYFENNLKVRMEQELYYSDNHKKYQHYENNLTFMNTIMEQEVSEEKSKQQVRLDAIQTKKQAKEEEVAEKKKEKEERKLARLDAKDVRKQTKQDQKQKKLDEIKAKKQAKIDALEAKKQLKMDAIQAKEEAKLEKKQERNDAIEAKRQAKIDKKQERIEAIQAKKQTKIEKKEEKIEERKARKQAIEDRKIAKEREIIENMLAKKKLKESAKLEKEEKRMLAQQEKERQEVERRKKELENNKAYKEKMRLKQEKEREAEKRLAEIAAIKKAKEDERKQKEEVALTKSRAVQLNKDEWINPSDIKEEADSIASSITSQEENMLIEEVLKDYLF